MVVVAGGVFFGAPGATIAWPKFALGRAEAATVTVRIGDSWFCDPVGPQPCTQPHDTTISVGNTVTWEWGAGGSGTAVVHTTTACADNFGTCSGPREWDSGAAQNSGTFSHTFSPEEAGKTFLYRCQIHPTSMRGRIIVQGAPTPTLAPTPAPTPTPLPTPPATSSPTPTVTLTPPVPSVIRLPATGGQPSGASGFPFAIAIGVLVMGAGGLYTVRMRRG